MKKQVKFEYEIHFTVRKHTNMVNTYGFWKDRERDEKWIDSDIYDKKWYDYIWCWVPKNILELWETGEDMDALFILAEERIKSKLISDLNKENECNNLCGYGEPYNIKINIQDIYTKERNFMNEYYMYH